MARDYQLYLSTHLEPTQALEKLSAQVGGLEWSEDRFYLFDDSASIRGIESDEDDFIEEVFHFNPTLIIEFRRGPDADWDRFREVLLDASLLLLEEAEGDAVLLFKGERIEIQRSGGQLTFNSESSYWRDLDWLERRLSQPFDWLPLPSPLL